MGVLSFCHLMDQLLQMWDILCLGLWLFAISHMSIVCVILDGTLLLQRLHVVQQDSPPMVQKVILLLLMFTFTTSIAIV